MTLDKKWLDFLEQVHADVEKEEIQRQAAAVLKSITAKAVHVGVKTEETKPEYGSRFKTEFDQFMVALTYKGNTVSMEFFKGEGLRKKRKSNYGTPFLKAEPVLPTVIEVMYSLLMDADSGDYSFEDFCGNFGYDEDSRKAEQTWRACQEQGRKLRTLLGSEYSTALVQAMNEQYQEMGY